MATSWSGAVNLPLRRAGGVSAMIASNFSVGSARRYISVVCTELCPSQRATFRTSWVVWSINIAHPCLNVCGDTRLLHNDGHFSLANATWRLSKYSNPVRVMASPRLFRKSSGTEASPRIASQARRLTPVRFQIGRTRSRRPFPRIRTKAAAQRLRHRL